ncbi:MAG: DUF6385 domain-containing protein [Lachnospiraceae bacterium]|nr:DUF6385 domain-containing protein [Lachnospiraceae bacterium]
MKNCVPIYMAKFNKEALIYFEVDEVEDADMVEAAYLLLKANGKRNSTKEIQCYINNKIDVKSLNNLYTIFSNKCSCLCENSVALDITEDFYLLTCSGVTNNGLIVECGDNDIYSCQLQVVYRGEIIYPSCTCMGFFEKNLILSSFKDKAISPYFFTATCSSITFSIHNMGEHPVSVNVQNSPDAKLFVNDTHTLVLLPNETGLIIPYNFTKYTRIVVTSENKCIITKLWYQTQLIR